MQSIFDLIKQETYSKYDLRDIVAFCRIEGTIQPLCAVAYIASDHNATQEDIIIMSNLLEKYPDWAVKFS